MMVALCLGLGAGSAALAADVTGHFIDMSTRGDWRIPNYGECFYLLPDPQRIGNEDPIDPDTNVCVGGSLVGQTDWSLVAGDPGSAGNVFVWSLTGDFAPEFGAEQWNPCVGAFKGATFDNGDAKQGIFNPLTNELTVTGYTGCLRLAYYFAEAVKVCRQQGYALYINGEYMDSGLVSDLSPGKYVVFDVCGLEGTSTITLDVQNTLNPGCPDLGIAPNTHLSGIFISDCEQEEVCAGTPGYYKKDRHWPEGVEEIMVGGETFSRDEAIDILKTNKKDGKCYTMFNALVAAKLNVIAGADSSCVADTIGAADAWFDDYCDDFDNVHASDPVWGTMGEPLYWELDDYNNGLLCACPRD